MSKTLTVKTQVQIDQTNRTRIDYPSDGYTVSDPDQLRVSEEREVGASSTVNLFPAENTDDDDWTFLYVEALNGNLTLALTTLQVSDDGSSSVIQHFLKAGCPFMLGTRSCEIAGTSRYISQVDVIEEDAATTTKVRYSLTRTLA